ncbi:glutathione ABC transporter substrate-binding protein [Paenactinomyces guangxiensis]|uniref:Glutathione ABC transporter substrate-binding protein n=1 Tax=Paenactinomyces guangxiensis TaxID=1490290 RepID=A0A7W1WRC3_9BACL|nr:glutathione ABC transporter substrate-binding protein [Paenactinomyces guangxiensis]MBA4494667.1 glutathione ABC transporter substrate-binding protein [Paenactinomyces guangxiensis]MBH8591751.1 glutathione ABC transporter substrate-binding protein [Paenactinomyces guangxiensis]
MVRRKGFKLLVTFCSIVALLAAGCTPAQPGASNQKLVYASTADVVGLSPIMTNDTPSANAINQIYETLVVRDPKTMEIKPKLAESYENPDPNTWVFKLRKGVTFHDGTPFNAEAVKYTFDKLRDPKTAAPRGSLLKPIDQIEVKDEHTVVIKTKEPYGAMLAALAHTNASIVSPTADKKGDLMKKPVGTGPYKLKEWVQGDHLILEANDKYWDGTAKVKEVEFRVVPELSTAISMLETNQVQMVDNLQPEQLERLKRNKNISIVTNEGTPVYYLGFNMKKAPTNNPTLRQGVAHAINQDEIVDMMKGLAQPSKGLIGPKVFGYKPEIEKEAYPYDLQKAKELIKQAGLEGKTLTITSSNTGNYPKLAELVQGQLKKAGLDVKIQTLEWGTYLDTTRQGQFELVIGAWTNSTGDGSELFYPNLHSDNIGTSNRTQTAIPEADQLIQLSRTTTDKQKRLEALHQANQLLVKQAPWVTLHHGVVVTATANNVKGLEVDPTGQWYLKDVSFK